MNIKKLLLTVATAAALTTGTGAALADPFDHHDAYHGERDGGDWGRRDGDHRDWDRHDWDRRDRDRRDWDHRDWDGDRMYVREHAWAGAPFWYHGRYVVRSYDRFGNAVFIDVNPGFYGEVRF